MGVVDEHWCSRCKKSLDKKSEEYLEMTSLNDPAVLGAICNKDDVKQAERFASGLLCQQCAKSITVSVEGKKRKQSLWVFLKNLRHKGNPNFRIFLGCESAHECETWESIRDDTTIASVSENGVNVAYARPCRHIALDLKGRMYCKRRHPGEFEVTQEEAVVEQQKREYTVAMLMNFLSEYPGLVKANPTDSEALKKLLEIFQINPANLHNPDPVLTGADMKLKPAKTGLKCSVCGEPQFESFSGLVCKNGHGGAPSI